jgi:hypothetical protein
MRISMKEIWKIVFLPLVLLIISCNQDPIFMMISNEVEPKEPLISGSPSKLVQYGDSIYVANGRLWRCVTANGKWGEVGGAPSKIYDIAAGSDGVYLLRVDDSDTSVHKLNGGAIGNSTGYDMIQGIYSDGGENPGTVYAGAMSGNDSYAILGVNNNAFTVIRTIDSPLAGVAKIGSVTYFATARNGILRRDGSTWTTVGSSSGYSIAGIINAKGKIIAVTGNGYILEVDATNSTVTAHSKGIYFTGGLAVYEGNDINGKVSLLLLGIKNSIYNMGYREMVIPSNPTDSIDSTLYIPGERASLSTVSGRDRYEATLAKSAVNSLVRLSPASGGGDGLPVLFASTQKDGLWSYRNNEWNAEE